MKLWPFGKRKAQETSLEIVPFPGGIEDVACLKLHGLRALCGAMMDRHYACRSPHPFCGQGHWKRGDPPGSLIVHVVQQRGADGGPLLALYLCRATRPVDSDQTKTVDAVEYAASLTYRDAVPFRKMAAFMRADGTYEARYGQVANPVEGNYMTGAIDQDDVRTFRCDANADHAKWQYWDSDLTEEQVDWPEFCCVQVYGEWFVVDMDRSQGEGQLVARIQVANNPDHNWGIHRPDRRSSVYEAPNDGSEWSRTLVENLGPADSPLFDAMFGFDPNATR